jgi:hypothetical protein
MTVWRQPSIHPMRFTGLVVKLAFMLLLLLTLAVSLTRAQPYDDSMLRAMLTTSDTCTLPCWQGIEPGVTNLHDALIALERSQWVGEVTRGSLTNRHTWWWNRNLPGWGRRVPQYLYTSIHNSGDEIADRISMSSVAELWQLWLIFGVPDTVSFDSIGDGKFLFVSIYEQLQVQIETEIDCTTHTLRGIWHGESALMIGEHPFQRDPSGFTASKTYMYNLIRGILDC